jgi:dynein heavy chain 1
MGLLFHPSAFITATRQATAQKNGWSLETLHMRIDLGQMSSEGGFGITGKLKSGTTFERQDFLLTDRIQSHIIGLQLEGAEITEGLLLLNNGSPSTIPPSTIVWERKPESAVKQGKVPSSVDLPFYINGERRALLATIEVGLGAGLNRVKVIQRGCCLKASA